MSTVEHAKLLVVEIRKCAGLGPTLALRNLERLLVEVEQLDDSQQQLAEAQRNFDAEVDHRRSAVESTRRAEEKLAEMTKQRDEFSADAAGAYAHAVSAAQNIFDQFTADIKAARSKLAVSEATSKKLAEALKSFLRWHASVSRRTGVRMGDSDTGCADLATATLADYSKEAK
jgi:hypothetical protein